MQTRRAIKRKNTVVQDGVYSKKQAAIRKTRNTVDNQSTEPFTTSPGALQTSTSNDDLRKELERCKELLASNNISFTYSSNNRPADTEEVESELENNEEANIDTDFSHPPAEMEKDLTARVSPSLPSTSPARLDIVMPVTIEEYRESRGSILSFASSRGSERSGTNPSSSISQAPKVHAGSRPTGDFDTSTLTTIYSKGRVSRSTDKVLQNPIEKTIFYHARDIFIPQLVLTQNPFPLMEEKKEVWKAAAIDLNLSADYYTPSSLAIKQITQAISSIKTHIVNMAHKRIHGYYNLPERPEIVAQTVKDLLAGTEYKWLKQNNWQPGKPDMLFYNNAIRLLITESVWGQQSSGYKNPSLLAKINSTTIILSSAIIYLALKALEEGTRHPGVTQKSVHIEHKFDTLRRIWETKISSENASSLEKSFRAYIKQHMKFKLSSVDTSLPVHFDVQEGPDKEFLQLQLEDLGSVAFKEAYPQYASLFLSKEDEGSPLATRGNKTSGSNVENVTQPDSLTRDEASPERLNLGRSERPRWRILSDEEEEEGSLL